MRLFRKLPTLQRGKQNLPFANKHWRDGVMSKPPHITLHFEYRPTLKDRMCVAWIENKNEVLIWKHGHKSSLVLNLSYHKTGSKMDLFKWNYLLRLFFYYTKCLLKLMKNLLFENIFGNTQKNIVDWIVQPKEINGLST